MKRKQKRKSTTSFYVLFGFNANQAAAHDDDADLNVEAETGYWTQEKVVSELRDATLFPDKNNFGIKGFGTPKQWLGFINEDGSLNHGFKFHLVKTCLKAEDYARQQGLKLKKLSAKRKRRLKAK